MREDTSTASRTTNARELVITRAFRAPRRLVWKAWTDPVHFRRWWGPGTFTCPACAIDLRVGGTYRNCMRSPDGKDFWTTGEYLEIVPLERLVYTDHFADEHGNIVPPSHYGFPGDWTDQMVVTVTFEDLNGGTKMTLRHTGLPAGELSAQTGMGWNESFDKLEQSLGQPQYPQTRMVAGPGTQEVVVTRLLDAPRELVFTALTDPGHIPHWWGPRRLSTTVVRMEVKEGGIWRFLQHDAAGNAYGFHGVYHDVVRPERLVWTFEFEGTPGHVMLETVTLDDLDGKTRVTDTAVFQSVADRDAMQRAGMEEGVVESTERLGELLRILQKSA